MITKQEASDLIYAGVLGCLDRADQTKLSAYIASGGELPANIGELQNIAAMLPIILQAETPDPDLKDKVARKLYRIKDQIRAKSTGEKAATNTAEVFYKNSRLNRKPTATEEKLSPSVAEESKGEENPQVPEVVDKKAPAIETKKELLKEGISSEIKAPEVQSADFEPVTPSRNTFESFKSTREKVLEGNFDDIPEEKGEIKEEEKPEAKIPTREKIKTYERVITKEKPSYKTSAKEVPYGKISTKERGKSFERAYKRRYMTEETPNKKTGMNFWLVISFFVILLLALTVLYLNFSSEIKDLKTTNDTLRQQVTDLSVKFNSTQEIQNILESSDVKVINLDGTGINPVGKGKLILSRLQNKGYLQLSDMPALGSNSSYQLWMQLPDGKYFSLGVFNPVGRIQYFPFKIPQSEGANISEFLVTVESSTGASNPGNKVFLTGFLQ
jgi:anti-sigma-K factor RskA